MSGDIDDRLIDYAEGYKASFEDWMKEVQNALVRCGFSESDVEDIEATAWREYYDRGCGPVMAMSLALAEGAHP